MATKKTKDTTTVTSAAHNVILASEKPKKSSKLRNPAYGKTIADQNVNGIGFESETDEAHNERTKAEIGKGMAKVDELRKRKPRAVKEAPQDAPAAPPAPKLPKAVKIAAPKPSAPVWTPELPYTALLNESNEVIGYAKENSGPGVAAIWMVCTLAGQTLGYALSRDSAVNNFRKKTGHCVSPKDIA